MVDGASKIIREQRIASEPEALIAWFRGLGFGLERIGLEAGPMSQWLHAAMRAAGTVKALDQQYMEAQLKRTGMPGPQVIGIDEIAIRKGHTYRIVVSDLLRGRPIWFGGKDRSEASMGEFYAWLGQKKSARIRLAVMDMWKPFRLATAGACAASGDFVRQVPCHAASG